MMARIQVHTAGHNTALHLDLDSVDTHSPHSPALPGTDVLLLNDAEYQNAWRADRTFDLMLAALRPFIKKQLINWYMALLEQLVTHNGAQVALKDLPVCTLHARKPGDRNARMNIATLNNCTLCGHWIKALGAAHASGNANKLAVSCPHHRACLSATSKLTPLNPHRFLPGCKALPKHVARP